MLLLNTDAISHLLRGTPGAGLQIAAVALSRGLLLVTGNVRHFEKVPGLQVVGLQ